MELDSIIRLLISILVCLVAAATGSLSTIKAVQKWYPGLRKPRFTPPNWVFGPVWFVLYVLMAVSVFFVWQKGIAANEVLIAFVLFWIQLAVNAAWSFVFFGLKSKGGGIITIIILWLLILATIIASLKVSVLAGYLLIPYIVWVSIATYLNIGVWLLNKTGEKNA
ncbi:MAG: tryptophan-rich sensory protein [Dehalococcoidales bacterium]|nr:tryptophan-rich sensory protein [Dehalococcoidales bacterium]